MLRIVADMLRTHAHNVTAPLCGVEQKLQRKPSAPDRSAHGDKDG
jgi:hypothetical protein